MKNAIFLSVLTLILLLAGCSKTDAVLKAFENEDYMKANEMYQELILKGKMEKNNEFGQIALEIVEKNMNQLINEKEYEQVLIQLDYLGEFPFLQEYIEKSSTLVNELIESQSNMEAGLKYLNDKDYDNALNHLNYVSENDKANYPKAMKLANEAYLENAKQYLKVSSDDTSNYQIRENYSFALTVLDQVSDEDKKTYKEAGELVNKVEKLLYKSYIESLLNDNLGIPDSLEYSRGALELKESKNLQKLVRYYELNSEVYVFRMGEYVYGMGENDPEIKIFGSPIFGKLDDEAVMALSSLALGELDLHIARRYSDASETPSDSLIIESEEQSFSVPLDKNHIYEYEMNSAYESVNVNINSSPILENLKEIPETQEVKVTFKGTTDITYTIKPEDFENVKKMIEYYTLGIEEESLLKQLLEGM